MEAVSNDTPQARTLRRAMDACGDLADLAKALGVSASDAAAWLEGHVQPPNEVFFRALDLVARSPIPDARRVTKA